MHLIESERRLHPRDDTDLAVKLSTGDRAIDIEIVNMSLGGARILWQDNTQTAERALIIGQYVEITFSTDLKMAGHVTRVSEYWLSVAFDIAGQDVAALAEKLSEEIGVELLAA